MLSIKRQIQITMFLLAIVSSTLLGMGLESQRLITIALIGATIGFVVTDLRGLFRIEGALANIASIVILYLAMNSFFSEDSTGKLVSVANLLVYLQTVLMFQEKTPRLNWQILVLSLLQVVVGTIFSLDFEAGLLFLLYFFVAGLAMVLQSIYAESVDVERRNRKMAIRMSPKPESKINHSRETGSAEAESSTEFAPLLFVDPGKLKGSLVGSMFLHLVLWISMATAFASVMFYLVPRHARPWFGPMHVEVTSTGVTKSVDLDERGLISLSNQLMFRVSFVQVGKDEAFEILDPPYFRGLALSSLVIENGKTNWQAPHDRVSRSYYQDIVHFPAKGVPLYQTITLEETTDPLIYGVMPFFQTSDSPRELAFCHEISALTRCRAKESIDMAPYKYQAGTIVDADGRFCKSWPYISNTEFYEQKPMSNDPPQHTWLTQMDPSRYQALVGSAERIAADHQKSGEGRIELLRKCEKFFLDPGRFQYTLDFRDVRRSDRIDPVEDFVRNHRSGHCELFASALTLMLRHQDIPARLVVGFHGAEYNSLTQNHMVRAKNAHAWVEAYLRPEDCTQEMMDLGQAGPGGAWLILDPTPFSFGNQAGSVGDGAIDLARTVWDDYVLGIDAEDVGGGASLRVPMFGFLSNLNIEFLESEFKRGARVLSGPAFKYTAALVVAFFCLLIWFRAKSRPRQNGTGGKSRIVGRLRRLVAGAISLIAPGLGAWVMEGAASRSPTAFYQRMHDLLETRGLSRQPGQTHREFAKEVATHFKAHPAADLIRSIVFETTELFNEVRFGKQELEPGLSDQLDLSLVELKEAFRTESLVAEDRVVP